MTRSEVIRRAPAQLAARA